MGVLVTTRLVGNEKVIRVDHIEYSSDGELGEGVGAVIADMRLGGFSAQTFEIVVRMTEPWPAPLLAVTRTNDSPV